MKTIKSSVEADLYKIDRFWTFPQDFWKDYVEISKDSDGVVTFDLGQDVNEKAYTTLLKAAGYTDFISGQEHSGWSDSGNIILLKTKDSPSVIKEKVNKLITRLSPLNNWTTGDDVESARIALSGNYADDFKSLVKKDYEEEFKNFDSSLESFLKKWGLDGFGITLDDLKEGISILKNINQYILKKNEDGILLSITSEPLENLDYPAKEVVQRYLCLISYDGSEYTTTEERYAYYSSVNPKIWKNPLDRLEQLPEFISEAENYISENTENTEIQSSTKRSINMKRINSKKINSEVESEAISTAEENLTESDTYGEDFVPAPEVVENPIQEPVPGKNTLPDTGDGIEEGEVDFTSDEVDAGIEETTGAPEASSSEVAGQEQAVEQVTSSTEEPNNDLAPEVNEIGLIGDAGEVLEDTATPESELYNFDSGEIAAIEVPVDEADDSQLLEMIEVQPGVFALQASYIRKNSKIRSSSFFRGAKAKKFLSSCAKTRSPIVSNLSGRVLALKQSGKALIFQNSNILGLIAVEAPLIRGIINSKYDLFTVKKGHLVSASKRELTSSTHRRVIASITSNRGVKASTLSRNLFSEVEQGYVRYLLSQNKKLRSSAKKVVSKLSLQNKVLRQRLVKLQSQRVSEVSELKNQIASSATNLSNLRNSVIAGRNPINSEAERKAAEQARIQSQAKIDRLSRMML